MMPELPVANAVRAIAGETRVPEALKKTLSVVEGLLRPRTTFVSLCDERDGRLAVAVTRGRSDERVAAVSPGEGPTGRAFLERRIVRDGTALAIPMLAGDEPVGTITCLGGARLREPLPEEFEEALLALAGSAALVVALARAREEVERRGHELRIAVESLRERDRVRDSVLSHLSHELRTPLTTIKLYLDMAEGGRLGALGERQKSAVQICRRNADRLLRFINDLLLTARLEAGQMALDPRPLGLRSVANEALSLLGDELDTAHVQAVVSAPLGEAYVRGNRDRLVEALMHLVERGLEGRREGRRLLVDVVPEDRRGVLRILHEGLLLPPEEVEQLFSAFRTDGGRSNLGLAIARRIVSLHGGTVLARATPDGLWFEVSFPLYAGAVATGARAPSPRAGEILVVEDDDDCRNGIVEALTAERFCVRACSDGREALERIRQSPPALLLVDLRIPGVDGARLIREVREGAGPSTPIYVISGAIDGSVGQEEAWGAQVDGVFEKPINFPFLLERVREYVSPA